MTVWYSIRLRSKVSPAQVNLETRLNDWRKLTLSSLSLRLGHGHLLSAVREAFPDTAGTAAAHGGPRRRAQLHLQRVQSHLPQPHRSQTPPALAHRSVAVAEYRLVAAMSSPHLPISPRALGHTPIGHSCFPCNKQSTPTPSLTTLLTHDTVTTLRNDCEKVGQDVTLCNNHVSIQPCYASKVMSCQKENDSCYGNRKCRYNFTNVNRQFVRSTWWGAFCVKWILQRLWWKCFYVKILIKYEWNHITLGFSIWSIKSYRTKCFLCALRHHALLFVRNKSVWWKQNSGVKM